MRKNGEILSNIVESMGYMWSFRGMRKWQKNNRGKQSRDKSLYSILTTYDTPFYYFVYWYNIFTKHNVSLNNI